MGGKLQTKLLIALITLFASNCSAFASPTKCRDIVNIGVILPLTAGAVSSGDAVKKSIILADEEYDLNSCVNFIFEDDQLLARNTVSIVNRLINQSKIDGFIIYGTPTSIAGGEITERHKIPLIALSILDKVVEGKKFIVKHWCTAERLNQRIVQEVKLRGYKSVAIFSTQNEAMLKLRDLFKASNVTKIAYDEEFVRENFDFRASITASLRKSVEAVYVLLYPPQVAPFVKQLRELGYYKDIFGAHNLEDPNEIKASESKMVGAWLANADDTLGENYARDFKERYKEPTTLGGGSGFDSAKLFIEAAYQDRVDINTYIHSVRSFNGAFGSYDASKKNDFEFVATIKRVEKDGIVILK